MNKVILRGYLRDIEYSHSIGDIEYEKANLICPSTCGREDDIISLKYKKYSNKYKEGDFLELEGNLRSYSTSNGGKNSVQIYVFTYFDSPEIISMYNTEIDGRICKIDELKTTKYNKPYLHFTLANNIFTNDKKINNYIPCTCYGDMAEELSKLGVNTRISICGEFHSHCYKKYITKDDFEYRVAHEVLIKKYEIME